MGQAVLTHKFKEVKPPFEMMVSGMFHNGEDVVIKTFSFHQITRKCADEKGNFINNPRRWWFSH